MPILYIRMNVSGCGLQSFHSGFGRVSVANICDNDVDSVMDCSKVNTNMTTCSYKLQHDHHLLLGTNFHPLYIFNMVESQLPSHLRNK